MERGFWIFDFGFSIFFVSDAVGIFRTDFSLRVAMAGRNGRLPAG
jgi:hypothetical protein